MVTLGELTAWLLVGLIIAWIWRGHGIRERALAFVRQHCKDEGIQLLDGNVALKGWRQINDGKGQKRLARMYGFEFTVTSQERLTGTVAMFGRHLGKIELQAYPVPHMTDDVRSEAVVQTHLSNNCQNSNVVDLRHWQSSNKPTD